MMLLKPFGQQRWPRGGAAAVPYKGLYYLYAFAPAEVSGLEVMGFPF
jgi:hypothetical protein